MVLSLRRPSFQCLQQFGEIAASTIQEVARLWRRLDDAEAAVRSAAQAAQQAEASGKQLLAGHWENAVMQWA